ncbi:hypothetical protein ACLB2K_062813 [Fragaria x ananassa]
MEVSTVGEVDLQTIVQMGFVQNSNKETEFHGVKLSFGPKKLRKKLLTGTRYRYQTLLTSFMANLPGSRVITGYVLDWTIHQNAIMQ